MVRGEVSSSQIVMWIIAIAGFIVLLIFLFSLHLTESGDEQACRLSALTRASLPEAVKTKSPLSCTTQKYCFTTNGSACALSMAGEKPDVVKLSAKQEAESAHTIEAKTAEAMYRCWQMMGQGKLDLFSTYSETHGIQAFTGLFQKSAYLEPSCVICSRFAVDASVNISIKERVNFKNYIATATVPGGKQTYLQSFTDTAVNTFPQVQPRTLTQIPDKASDFAPRADEYAVVFMQIHAPTSASAVKGLFHDVAVAGAVGGAGAFYIVPGTIVSKGVALYGFAQKNLKLLAGLGRIVAPVAVASAGAVWLGAQASQELAAGYCGEYAPDKNSYTSSGCSMVQVVPYDAKAINQLCGNIEGTP